MKYKYLLIAVVLGLCANANADWFLRGTHNAWGSTQMLAGGTNTMQLNGVVFTAAGSIKFDRFGDWKESYGVGGLGGSNIPVAAGTWDIKFFTNSKTWSITASQVVANYHLRGTFNSWLEGTLMTRLGTTNTYESCINFVGGDANGGPRFKIDPNGGWGDGIPAADVVVAAGWVKISFNSQTKAISTQQNLAINCGVATSSSVAVSSSAISLSSVKSSQISSSSVMSVSSSSVKSSSVALSLSSKSSVVSSLAVSSAAVSSAAPSSIYHVRGTFNGWAEGTLMTRVATTNNYEYCANFTGSNPRFKIDPNGAWGDGIPAADFVVTVGWVKITFNSATKAISVQQNLAVNCVTASSIAASSVVASSVTNAPSSIYHVRGTFNSWAEGTLMTRIGTTDSYEKCVNFVGGDTNGGPRFKIDPNGAWGDGIPAADFVVTAGWVKITFNSSSKAISVQQNLPANCVTASSSAVSSTSAPASIYHVRGTFNGWLEGALMTRVGTTAIYEKCIKFPTDPTGPRFKIDLNGGWGADVLPSPTGADVTVTAGWVKITLNSSTKAISLQQNLSTDCRPLDTSGITHYTPEYPEVYLRSSIDNWGPGLLMYMFFEDVSFRRNLCVPVSGTAQFRVVTRDRNGEESFDLMKGQPSENYVAPPTTFTDLTGYSDFEFLLIDSWISLATNKDSTCGSPEHNPQYHKAFPTTPQPSKPFIPVHVRGTHNGWAEGVLMTQLGTTDDYEACVNIPEGDADGGPRFKIDPNGGWLDETPAANVPAGWVRIRYNTTTKKMMKRAYLNSSCVVPVYSLAGTHFTYQGELSWKVGDLFEYIDGDIPEWKICRNFAAGDRDGPPRLQIIRDHEDQTLQSLPQNQWAGRNVYPVNGWTYVSFTNNHLQPTILTNLGPNCAVP